MSKNRKKCIEKFISKKKDEIEAVNENFFGDVVSVAQASGQLKEALEKVDACLDKRKFEEASQLGYRDIASEFIFLQRCLGALNDTVTQKQKVIQDICIELCNELDNVSYEEVAPLVEAQIETLEPIDNPMKIEILIGKKTAQKLQSLQNIRHTPIEHLVELILASAMKDDEKNWRKLEKSKALIPNIKSEKKKRYTGDEVFDHLKALGKQEKERSKNLY